MNELAGCHPAHSPQTQAPSAFPPATHTAMNSKPHAATRQHTPTHNHHHSTHTSAASTPPARNPRSRRPASASSHSLPRRTVKISPDYREAVQTVGVVALAQHIKREIVDSWVDLPLSSPGRFVDVQAPNSLSNLECERLRRSRAHPRRSCSPGSRVTSPSAPSRNSPASQSPQRAHSKQHWLYSAARSCVEHQQQQQRQEGRRRPQVFVQDKEGKRRPRSKTGAPPVRKSSFHKHQAYNRPRSPSQPQRRRHDSDDDAGLSFRPQHQDHKAAGEQAQANEKETLPASSPRHIERQLSRPMTPPPGPCAPSSTLSSKAGRERVTRPSSTGTTDSALTTTPAATPEPASTLEDRVDRVVEAVRSALLQQARDHPERLATLLQQPQQPCRKNRPSSRDPIRLPHLRTGEGAPLASETAGGTAPLELALPALNLKMRAVFSPLQAQPHAEAGVDDRQRSSSAALENDAQKSGRTHAHGHRRRHGHPHHDRRPASPLGASASVATSAGWKTKSTHEDVFADNEDETAVCL